MPPVIRLLFLPFILVSLVHCGSAPTKPDEETPVEFTEDALGQAMSLLQEAENTFGAERAQRLLLAAELLNKTGDREWASTVLGDISAHELDSASYAKRALIYSDIAVSQGDYFSAKGYLNDANVLGSLNAIPKELSASIIKRRAEIYFDLAEYHESILERIKLNDYLPSHFEETQKDTTQELFERPEQPQTVDGKEKNRITTTDEESLSPRQANQNQIWLTVMEMPIDALKTRARHPGLREAQGWYQLGLLSKVNQANLSEQLAQLNQWVIEWPEHPASLSLPADLQLLSELVENKAKHLAVLLPFTGKFAQASNAIRDGILAAHYESQKHENERDLEEKTNRLHTPVSNQNNRDISNLEENPERSNAMPENLSLEQYSSLEQHSSPEQYNNNNVRIKFYNTDGVDIGSVYDEAVLNGAELIIGPLNKDAINELALRPELPVPTLSLNNIDNPLGYVPQLFQFSLAVEDEAKQAARQAYKEGHRRALVIAPENLWGDRSVNAFAEEWRRLGGEVADNYRYTGANDYSPVIKSAFHVDQSQDRGREMLYLIGHIEFEPRRREDIDMIFVVGHSHQMRQIKPTLAFHYAGTIPVYSTSHVYTGIKEPQKDKDMNAVKFSTLPWFFNNTSEEKAILTRYASENPQLQRLYALGVDAYQVYPRLKQLYSVRHAQYYGYTGVLTLNDLGQIERQQTWAQFERGQAKPL